MSRKDPLKPKRPRAKSSARAQRSPEALEYHRARLRVWIDELAEQARQEVRRELRELVEPLTEKPYGKHEAFRSTAECKAELEEAGERLLLRAHDWFGFN